MSVSGLAFICAVALCDVLIGVILALLDKLDRVRRAQR